MIIRRRHNGNFTVVGNAAINDDRLSFEAVGLLTYILSKPDDWEVRLPQLRKRANIGRDRLRRIVGELVALGYVLRKKLRDATGAFVGDEFQVYDQPQIVDDEDIDRSTLPAPENPALDEPAPGYPAPGYPAPENPSLVYKKDSTKDGDSPNTDSTKVEREARAKLPDPKPEDDVDFQALLGKAARAGGPQPIGRCFPLWLRKPPEKRRAALDGWDPSLAAWRDAGRKHPFGLETYLRDEMWEQVPKSSAGEAQPKTMLALRTGEWFGHFFAKFTAGHTRTCAAMLSAARQNVGRAVELADVPSPAHVQSMPKVERSGEAWRSWRRHLLTHGLSLDDAYVPLWVWVPSEYPPGWVHGPPEASEESEERELQAEGEDART